MGDSQRLNYWRLDVNRQFNVQRVDRLPVSDALMDDTSGTRRREISKVVNDCDQALSISIFSCPSRWNCPPSNTLLRWSKQVDRGLTMTKATFSSVSLLSMMMIWRKFVRDGHLRDYGLRCL